METNFNLEVLLEAGGLLGRGMHMHIKHWAALR